MQTTAIFNSAASGEVSLLMAGRTDWAGLPNAVRKASNFLVTSQGPLIRRGGTEFMATVSKDASEVVLVPFIFSERESYVIEITDRTLRIHGRDGLETAGEIKVARFKQSVRNLSAGSLYDTIVFTFSVAASDFSSSDIGSWKKGGTGRMAPIATGYLDEFLLGGFDDEMGFLNGQTGRLREVTGSGDTRTVQLWIPSFITGSETTIGDRVGLHREVVFDGSVLSQSETRRGAISKSGLNPKLYKILQLPSLYAKDALPNIRYAQSLDTLFLFNASETIRTLIRKPNKEWAYRDYRVQGPERSQRHTEKTNLRIEKISLKTGDRLAGDVEIEIENGTNVKFGGGLSSDGWYGDSLYPTSDDYTRWSTSEGRKAFLDGEYSSLNNGQVDYVFDTPDWVLCTKMKAKVYYVGDRWLAWALWKRNARGNGWNKILDDHSAAPGHNSYLARSDYIFQGAGSSLQSTSRVETRMLSIPSSRAGVNDFSKRFVLRVYSTRFGTEGGNRHQRVRELHFYTSTAASSSTNFLITFKRASEGEGFDDALLKRSLFVNPPGSEPESSFRITSVDKTQQTITADASKLNKTWTQILSAYKPHAYGGGDVPRADWIMSSWGSGYNTAATGTFFQDRLVISCVGDLDSRIMGSKVGDYSNFNHLNSKNEVTAETAWSIKILSRQFSRNRWVIPLGDTLAIGTDSGIWSIGPESETDKVLSAENIRPTQITTRGASVIDTLAVDGNLLYVPRSRTALYELFFTWESDSYQNYSLSKFAEHLPKDGIIQTAYQEYPYGIVWCLLETGKIIAITYNRESKTAAWHQHDFGNVKSICCIPSEKGDETELWMVIDRDDLPGKPPGGRLAIERLTPVWDAKSSMVGVLDDDKKHRTKYAHFLDSGVLVEKTSVRQAATRHSSLRQAYPFRGTIISVDSATRAKADDASQKIKKTTIKIGGLHWLAGKVDILINGIRKTATIDKGVAIISDEITYSASDSEPEAKIDPVNGLVIGYRYISEMQSFSLENNIPSALPGGGILNKSRTLNSVTVTLLSSRGGQVGTYKTETDSYEWNPLAYGIRVHDILQKTAAPGMGGTAREIGATDLFNAVLGPIAVNVTVNKWGSIGFKQEDPYPFNLIGFTGTLST